MTDPKAIYQAHLDVVSSALWHRDFEAVSVMMHYPDTIVAKDLTQRFDVPADNMHAARLMRESIARLGATAYHRICVMAEFVEGDQDRIVGRHRTYLLNGGTYVIPPFESDMTLRRVGARWLGAGIRHPFAIARLTTLDPARAQRTHTDQA